MTIEPDTKDWTWVLANPCPECGFDAPDLDRTRIPQAIRDNATLWEVVLGTDDAAVRPSPHVWSPLEYACHARDVNRLFEQRVRAMLAEEVPQFENWDQDATAAEDDYGVQRPEQVAGEVTAAAASVAATYEAVPVEAWQRRGVRGDGAEFTVDSLARYHLHDLVHHAHDVSHVTKRVTVDSYDQSAEQYRAELPEMSAEHRAALARFAASLPAGARVLEIGSGSGRDARILTDAGLSVRPTDIAPGFVWLLRQDGWDATTVDPLVDDLTDPDREAPYDGVWASASLLHVRREDLPRVVANLASVTREGGVLHLAVKEGDGARFSTHGSVAGPRHFTFWREGGLREVLAEAGWDTTNVERSPGRRGETWLDVSATRR